MCVRRCVHRFKSEKQHFHQILAFSSNKKKTIDGFNRVLTSDSSFFSLQYKWVWIVCFLGFRNALDDFHWCFKAVLLARIAMLLCLCKLKSKLFQVLRASPDSTYITLVSKNSTVFCTSRLLSVKMFLIFLKDLFAKYTHVVNCFLA